MHMVVVERFSLGEVVVIVQLCPKPYGVRKIVYTVGPDVGMPYYRKESIQHKRRIYPQISRRYTHGCVSLEVGLR